MSDEFQRPENSTAPRSPAAKAFAVVLLSLFLVIWLTMTLGMSRIIVGIAPSPISWLPILFAIIGTVGIGGSIVGILFFKPSSSRADRAGLDSIDRSSGPRTPVDPCSCSHCGIRFEKSAPKCPGCGAPNRA